MKKPYSVRKIKDAWCVVLAGTNFDVIYRAPDWATAIWVAISGNVNEGRHGWSLGYD